MERERERDRSCAKDIGGKRGGEGWLLLLGIAAMLVLASVAFVYELGLIYPLHRYHRGIVMTSRRVHGKSMNTKEQHNSNWGTLQDTHERRTTPTKQGKNMTTKFCEVRKRELLDMYSPISIRERFEDLKARRLSKCVPWPGVYAVDQSVPNDYWARKDCTEAFGDQFVKFKHWRRDAREDEMEFGLRPDRDHLWDRTKVGNMIFNGHYQDDILLFLLFFTQPKLLSGTFVEFGAWDGVKHSTTAAFERNFKWQGLLLEPSSCFELVKRNRPKARPIKGAICVEPGNFTGTDFAECKAETVGCFPLQHYLDNHRISQVDFLSVDTEGHEIVDVTTIDYNRTHVSVVMAEVNGHEHQLKSFFGAKGYYHIELRGLPGGFWDLVFWSPTILAKAVLEREDCVQL